MSQVVKEFEIRQDPVPKPPIPFKLTFTRMVDGAVTELEIHQFEAVGDAPAGADLANASLLRFDAHGEQEINLDGITNYFRVVMPREDYRRFRNLLDDQKVITKLPALIEVWKWLTSTYAARPTSLSPASSGGRQTIEATATELPVTPG